MLKGQKTRAAILQKGVQLIYERGYRDTSLDELLAAVPVTKGSFYHHFRSKSDMGIALISEVLKPAMQGLFEKHLRDESRPVDAIIAMLAELLHEAPELRPQFGCPVGNLIQELAGAGGEFQEALTDAVSALDVPMQDFLERAIAGGHLSKEARPRAVSSFILSGYWGVRVLGRLGEDRMQYDAFLGEMRRYLSGFAGAR